MVIQSFSLLQTKHEIGFGKEKKKKPFNSILNRVCGTWEASNNCCIRTERTDRAKLWGGAGRWERSRELPWEGLWRGWQRRDKSGRAHSLFTSKEKMHTYLIELGFQRLHDLCRHPWKAGNIFYEKILKSLPDATYMLATCSTVLSSMHIRVS